MSKSAFEEAAKEPGVLKAHDSVGILKFWSGFP